MNHKIPFTQSTRELMPHVQEFVHLFPYTLSKNTKTHLKHLCKLIHHSAKHSPILQRENIEDMDAFMSKTKVYPLYNAIPEIIREKIGSSEKTGRTYRFTIDNRDITIHFVLPKSNRSNTEYEYSRIYESEELTNAFFDSCIYKITVWLQVAYQFAGKTCAKHLTCYLFFTDHIKILPKKQNESFTIDENSSPLDQEHANTGMTTSCTPDSTIMMYRMEEWFKVFIHETFHALGLDFSEMDTTESNKQIIHLFPGCSRDLDVRVYETYCEMWAEILNVLCIAYFAESEKMIHSKFYNKTTRVISKNARRTRKRSESVAYSRILSKTMSTTQQFIKYERAYTMYQAAKVLTHYRLTYYDLCKENTPDKTYRERTPVFSYYIVKSVLFYHMNEFVDWCYKHNRGYKTILHFMKTQENIREYGRLIGRLYKTEDFIQKLNQMVNYRKKHTHNMTEIVNTLLMTLHEV